MDKAYLIAINTFREMIRDRVLYMLLFFSFFLIAFSYLLGFLSFAEQERIIANMGLATIQIACCGIAIFLGSALVWREIEKQTVLVLLSKPVSRFQFLFGKYLGLTFVLILLNIFLSLVLFFVCFKFSFFNFKNFFYSQFGTFLESQILLSLAMFFGVFCKPILTVLFSISTWVIGHFMSDLHFFSQKSQIEIYKKFGYYFSRYFLNLEKFNFREAVIYQDPVSFLVLAQSAAYALSWLVLLMFITHKIFDRRDFV